jgi:ribulose-5-phosphate 4-epimerase/fuculose-1-phosphate aldolase
MSVPIHALDAVIDDIVTANRILAAEGVVDAFGHVSARHPDRPDRFLLSRALAPELITHADIVEYALDGTPSEPDAAKGYLERFIHGALYEARADVQAVIHSHSRSVIPFGVTSEPLRPIVHSCATIGHHVPVWDAQDSFGDTTLLIGSMEMGRDFARVLADNSSALMRGHGSTVIGRSVREATYTAVYLEVNASLQLQASRLGSIKFLSAGEIDKISARLADAKPAEGYDRAWDYWARRAGLEPRPRFVG